MRAWCLALAYGGLAGAVTALTLAAMKWLEHVVWHGQDSAVYVAAAVMAGGCVIAALRRWVPQRSVQDVVNSAHSAVAAQRRWALAVAATAVVAVALGGAVGPEAGLIAVVTELAAWVALVVGRQRRAELAELGVAASLSAWWGAPPAAAVLAVLLAWWPVLRFSGHHELAHLPDWLLQHGPWALLALAALKVVALSLCLASGWLGGAVFPLLLAGASAGLACVVWMPGLPADVAMAAGMAGAATLGMGKPVVAVLVLLFLAGPATLPAVCVGALLAYLASQRWSVQGLH